MKASLVEQSLAIHCKYKNTDKIFPHFAQYSALIN